MKTKEEIVGMVEMLYSIRSKTNEHVFEYGESMSKMLAALILEDTLCNLSLACEKLAEKLSDAVSTAQTVKFIEASQCCDKKEG